MKENWRLLMQFCFVIVATSVCMLAGPIAKASLRTTRIIRGLEVEVLQASKGAGFIGNRLRRDIDWNSTIDSLDKAGFPYDRLPNYLPPAVEPWVYVPNEWEATWSADCDYYNEILL